MIAPATFTDDAPAMTRQAYPPFLRRHPVVRGVTLLVLLPVTNGILRFCNWWMSTVAPWVLAVAREDRA